MKSKSFVGGESLHNSYVKGVLTSGPGRDLLFDGLRAFKKGSPNMNSLVGFGSVAAFIISLISLLNPGMAWDASFFHEPHAGHASWIQASSGMNELLDGPLKIEATSAGSKTMMSRIVGMDLPAVQVGFRLWSLINSQVKLCPTVVNKICRKEGLATWPHRKIKSIVKLINILRGTLNSDDARSRAQTQAEISRLIGVCHAIGGLLPVLCTPQANIRRPLAPATTTVMHGTVFAYGVTSSGKTHTMHGEQKSPGIIPLAVKDVFSIIQATPGREFLLRVSYLEIYIEVINDLLNPTGQDLRIREDAQILIFSFRINAEHRHVGSNNFNLVSSRSHTIFTLTIESSSHGEDTGEEDVILSHLHLIDLAGSESSKIETTGSRRKEGSYINKSLLTLGTVISKLTDGKATHIPYRDSKLTRLLQSSLSGHGQISVSTI
ncbi:kinesin-like protein KIN-7C, mitochondrial isoform X1 [Senna tora]|uniref:Kinesin-like protein n=1 Tax=Senna tora TaxID=362788 RepID=A0A834X3G9_9FABA|nr:kinesin-like protein KIN-7C, mitochondrial isoform X1 [Senna tora]